MPDYGGQYNATPPTVADKQWTALQLDSAGNLKATIVSSTAITPGTAAANLGKAEDAAHASGDTGVMFLGVRNDTNASATSATGDYGSIQIDPTGSVITKPYSPAATDWQYAAAASGILNTTTAVTIKAAGGAGLRNYITGISIMAEALGAATEVAIRDGAAGTVIWRTKIGTGGLVNGINIVFPTPLKGTAATLLEVVTLTASVTGAVYFNAQGYVGP